MKSQFFHTKLSKIPGAGEGLYSNVLIAKGSPVIISFRKNGKTTGIFETDYDQTQLNSKVNHSDNPNLSSQWLKGHGLMIKVALRDIHPGEELTSDYAQTMRIIEPLGYQLAVNFLWFKPDLASALL